MPYYRTVGEIPKKRHTQFRKPDGGLYSEELMGEEGFSDDSALLYHLNPPTAIIDSVAVDGPTSRRVPNQPLLPRHFKTHKLDSAASHDPVLGRQHLFANGDIRISYVAARQPSPLYRNAIGDECVYVESGTAVLESVFGALEVGPGDHVLVPASATHRWVPTGDEPLRTLVVEASGGGHITPPRRYLSVPRLFDYHPHAIPAPYNHATVDSDEILFYVGGDFMSRKGAGVEMGSLTLHPAGFVHGPQPGSVEASIGKKDTEEYAVMIDTFKPLELCEPVFACEDTSYAWSWSGGRKVQGDR